MLLPAKCEERSKEAGKEEHKAERVKIPERDWAQIGIWVHETGLCNPTCIVLKFDLTCDISNLTVIAIFRAISPQPYRNDCTNTQNRFSPPNLSHPLHHSRGQLQSSSVVVAAIATLSAGNAALQQVWPLL
ncbi:hypothetical protein L195_g001506 [Trifolium pratense]|uniref:Uncharacterized protein n=1 Tax=Trifolium pratense TaxID=57577 RepID=A0A2K3NPW9_TRIPR|nr:hypothetical protein L195_g001506 [Trifolium pratense]